MIHVAPLVGAWIEIALQRGFDTQSIVAPLVGAWIEIYVGFELDKHYYVAPLVGAWIEIVGRKTEKIFRKCRSPRGSVD